MPTFCRHSRLVQNCPICSREQDVEMRPVLTPGGQHISASRPASAARSGSGGAARAGSPRTRSGNGRSSGGMTVRRLAREADDGFQSRLVPGLHSGAGVERLAAELVFSAGRLESLAADPPGLYAEVANPAHDLEERSWLAFQVAYFGPLDGDAPFEAIDSVRTTWASGELPDLDGVQTGPRTSHDPARGTRTLDAYRAWAARAGSQAAGFSGETGWTPQRRFARAFERLALPGFDRGPRFDLLTTLGRLGVYELHAGALAFGGSDTVTLAAKRVLGIGDPLLLERRAADLAGACGLPLDALDVGLFNWERGTRSGLGVDAEQSLDEAVLQAALSALGLG